MILIIPFAAILASPLARKVMMYGAIALGGLLLLRWHDNRIRDDQDKKTAIRVRDEVIKEHQAEWRIQQEELDSLRKGLVAEHAAIEAERATVVAGRTAIVSTLQRGQQALGQKIDALAPYIANVPAAEIDNEIRKSLEALR